MVYERLKKGVIYPRLHTDSEQLGGGEDQAVVGAKRGGDAEMRGEKKSEVLWV
jgi:hypothetical protein